MAPELVVTDAPGDADRDAIGGVLRAHNDAAAGPSDRRPLAVLIRGADGATQGGLWAVTARGWLHVELLAIPAALRGSGIGTRLLRQAEAEAVARGCTGAWLDTFSFQARGFYEKLGYRVFGTLDDFPPGHQRFFLTKPLRALTPPPAATAP